MRRSLYLGSALGTGVYVHWTFFLLVAWVALSGLMLGLGAVGVAYQVALLLALFGCVVLHEFGHVAAAKYFGIPTRDVTLLPIGGVARLERMPTKPSQELVVALAGPMVNVVIVAVLFLLLPGTVFGTSPLTTPNSVTGLLGRLAWINVALVVFNMIPAFPLDGGRVFRAVLAMFTNRVKATRVAAAVGQVFAVVLGLLGLFVVGNPLLAVVAAFIFFAAAGEARGTMLVEALQGYRARDVMMTNFRVLSPNLSVEDASFDLLATPQRVYPVVEPGSYRVLGVVTRGDLVSAAQRYEFDLTTGDVMSTEFETVHPDQPLEEVFQGAGSDRICLVIENGSLVGMLSFEAALETIEFRKALVNRPPVFRFRRVPNEDVLRN